MLDAQLKKLKARVAEVCKAVGRDPAEVRILAVSKLHPLEKIREAAISGQTDFAENYVQEALDKIEHAGDLAVNWHFIGRIQSNKTKFLNDRFVAIHSVDRASIAEALNRGVTDLSKRQDIFLQFNVANEPTKGGISDENELENLFHFVVEHCPGLRVLGLMVMPPPDLPARAFFARARLLLLRLRGTQVQDIHPLDQLSMGTSGDFVDAIAEGATWIRIGTDIFGPREERGF